MYLRIKHYLGETGEGDDLTQSHDKILERSFFVRSICFIQLKFSWMYVRIMFLKLRVIDGENIVKISRGIIEHIYEVKRLDFWRSDIKSLS